MRNLKSMIRKYGDRWFRQAKRDTRRLDMRHDCTLGAYTPRLFSSYTGNDTTDIALLVLATIIVIVLFTSMPLLNDRVDFI